MTEQICPDCAAGDHSSHASLALASICIGCACDWTPPASEQCTCPDRGDGYTDDLCPVHGQ